MPRIIHVLTLCVGLALGAAASLTMVPSSADEPSVWTPPAKTVVAVAGDAENGFEVHHYDGSSISVPTWPRAKWECLGHYTRIRRAQCSAEIRVRYAALDQLQVALRHAYQAALHD